VGAETMDIAVSPPKNLKCVTGEVDAGEAATALDVNSNSN